jgi:hypothetical protein
VDLGPGGEALKVPDLSGRGAFGEALGRVGLEQGAGIREQGAVLVFQNGEDVFAMVEQEVVEAGVGVQGIAENHVEGSRKVRQQPLEQAHSRGDLIFPRSLGLDIEQDWKIPAQEQGHHRAVVVLNALSVSRGNRALQAL